MSRRTGSLGIHSIEYVRFFATPALRELIGAHILTAKAMKSGQGALAQYLQCPANQVVARPSFLKPTEAAGLGIVGLTAYHALFNMAKIEPGQNVFINGGSTGVGIAAIQMAKSIGCSVTASGSTQREALFKSLGVDTVSLCVHYLRSATIHRDSREVYRLREGTGISAAGE